MSKNDSGSPDSQKIETVRIFEDGTMTINEAAKALNVASMTVRDWIKKGLRVAFGGEGKKGVPARILLKDVIDFHASRNADKRFDNGDGEIYELEYEKARRAHMLADLEEMRRDRERGEIVKIDDVVTAVDDEFALVRAGFLGLPSRVVVKLTTMTDQREIHDYLRDECVQILSDLSNGVEVASRSVKALGADEVEAAEAAFDDGEV